MGNTHMYFKCSILLVAATLLSGCQNMGIHANTIVTLSQNFPNLWRLATAFAYLAGIIFIFRAVFQLKQYGEMTAMRASGTTIKGPIILFICGSALIFLPTIKASLLASSFGYSNQLPISYSSSSGIVDVATKRALMQLMQLMGIIAFVRGWIQLSHLSSPSGGQHSVGKALTHIIGGLCAINIQGTVYMLQSTFGVS